MRVTYDEVIERAPHIRLQLKSVRREHGKTGQDRKVCFTDITTSDQTAVDCCSTESHLAPVTFPHSFDSRLVLRAS